MIPGLSVGEFAARQPMPPAPMGAIISYLEDVDSPVGRQHRIVDRDGGHAADDNMVLR